MSNKKQTAVDWLLQQFDEEKTPRQWEDVYKKAKQLEKRQMSDAVVWFDDTDRRPKQIEEDFEQYYNETYGND